MSETLSIYLISPTCDINLDFHCPKSKADHVRDENYIIIDLIKWVIEDIDELRDNEILSDSIKAVNYQSFYSIQNLCEIYNKVISELKETWKSDSIKPQCFGQRAKIPLLKFIIAQCYNRSVREPEKLNQYPPFSAQVYGETSFELVLNILDEINVLPSETFIDLGSGVGQVVIQIAALADVKLCHGIEKAEYPAACASRLEKEFRKWMDFLGKKYSPFIISKGDFLTPAVHDIILSADVIFANNFAFGPEVDHQLKLKFQNLKEGTRIISSKAFCPLNFRISDRNLGDIGSIMRVSTLSAISNAVSWTDKPFSYFIHVIDRKILEDYFYRSKNPKHKYELDGSTKNERNRRQLSTQTGDVRTLRKSLLIRKKSHKIQRKRTASAKPGLLQKAPAVISNEIKHTSPNPDEIGKPPRKSSSCHSMNSTPTNSCSSSDFVINPFQEEESNQTTACPTNSDRSRQSKPVGGQLSEKSMIERAFKSRVKTETKKAEKRKSSSSTSNLEEISKLHQHTSSSIDIWTKNNEKDPMDTPYNDVRLVSPEHKYPRIKLDTMNNMMQHAVTTTDNILSGQVNDCTPVALHQYLELCRKMFMIHFRKSQTPEYAENLRRQIVEEQDRNARIKEKLTHLEDSIDKLNEEGAQLLKKCSSKLGIKLATPVQFFTEARKIIKTRAGLEQKIETLIAEINELSTENTNLKSESFSRQQQQQQVTAGSQQNPRIPIPSLGVVKDINNSMEFSCPPELSPLTKQSKKSNNQPQRMPLDSMINVSLNDSHLLPPPPDLTLMNLSPNKQTYCLPNRCAPHKSMHSTFQDIISEEISPQSNNDLLNTSMQSFNINSTHSNISELAKETSSPSSVSPHSGVKHPSTGILTSTPPLDHCLPPRKRHWESQLKQSATAGS